MAIEIAPSPAAEMTYNEALMYCFFLEHNGRRGWRLPTFAEYMQNPAIEYGWLYDFNIVGGRSNSDESNFTPVKDLI